MQETRTYQWLADEARHDAPAFFDDYEPHIGAVYANAPDCGAEEAKVAVTAAHADGAPSFEHR
jgi:hypothetical protein